MALSEEQKKKIDKMASNFDSANTNSLKNQQSQTSTSSSGARLTEDAKRAIDAVASGNDDQLPDDPGSVQLFEGRPTPSERNRNTQTRTALQNSLQSIDPASTDPDGPYGMSVDPKAFQTQSRIPSRQAAQEIDDDVFEAADAEQRRRDRQRQRDRILDETEPGSMERQSKLQNLNFRSTVGDIARFIDPTEGGERRPTFAADDEKTEFEFGGNIYKGLRNLPSRMIEAVTGAGTSAVGSMTEPIIEGDATDQIVEPAVDDLDERLGWAGGLATNDGEGIRSPMKKAWDEFYRRRSRYPDEARWKSAAVGALKGPVQVAAELGFAGLDVQDIGRAILRNSDTFVQRRAAQEGLQQLGINPNTPTSPDDVRNAISTRYDRIIEETTETGEGFNDLTYARLNELEKSMMKVLRPMAGEAAGELTAPSRYQAAAEDVVSKVVAEDVFQSRPRDVAPPTGLPGTRPTGQSDPTSGQLPAGLSVEEVENVGRPADDASDAGRTGSRGGIDLTSGQTPGSAAAQQAGRRVPQVADGTPTTESTGPQIEQRASDNRIIIRGEDISTNLRSRLADDASDTGVAQVRSQVQRQDFVSENVGIDEIRQNNPQIDEVLDSDNPLNRDLEPAGVTVADDATPIVDQSGRVIAGAEQIARQAQDGEDSVQVLRGFRDSDTATQLSYQGDTFADFARGTPSLDGQTPEIETRDITDELSVSRSGDNISIESPVGRLSFSSEQMQTPPGVRDFADATSFDIAPSATDEQARALVDAGVMEANRQGFSGLRLGLSDQSNINRAGRERLRNIRDEFPQETIEGPEEATFIGETSGTGVANQRRFRRRASSVERAFEKTQQSTKVMKEIVDQFGVTNTINKQQITNILNEVSKREGVKKPERELISEALDAIEGDEVTIGRMLDEVNSRLTPLTRNDPSGMTPGGKSSEVTDTRWGSISLRDGVPVAEYRERMWQGPIKNRSASGFKSHFTRHDRPAGKYFAHSRFEDLAGSVADADGKRGVRRYLEVQSDLMQQSFFERPSKEIIKISNGLADRNFSMRAQVKESGDERLTFSYNTMQPDTSASMRLSDTVEHPETGEEYLLIKNVQVDEPARGKGVATKMYNKAIIEAKEMDLAGVASDLQRVEDETGAIDSIHDKFNATQLEAKPESGVSARDVRFMSDELSSEPISVDRISYNDLIEAKKAANRVDNDSVREILDDPEAAKDVWPERIVDDIQEKFEPMMQVIDGYAAVEDVGARENFLKEVFDEEIMRKTSGPGAPALGTASEAKEILVSSIVNDDFAQSYKNIWHEMVLRKEMRESVEAGMDEVRFPTGKTALEIEGLDDLGMDVQQELNMLRGENTEPGTTFTIADTEYRIVDQDDAGGVRLIEDSMVRQVDEFYNVLREAITGHFDDVDSFLTQKSLDATSYNYATPIDGSLSDRLDRQTEKLIELFNRKEGISVPPAVEEFSSDVLPDGTTLEIATPGRFDVKHTEGFILDEPAYADDVLQDQLEQQSSIDESSPIYLFYEEDIGGYLKKRYDAEKVQDENGRSWWKVNSDAVPRKMPREGATPPAEAFGAAAGAFEEDEDGNIRFELDPVQMALGAAFAGSIQRYDGLYRNGGDAMEYMKNVLSKHPDFAQVYHRQVRIPFINAVPGERYMMDDGTWDGYDSTFPDWVPEETERAKNLRSNELFNRVDSMIGDGPDGEWGSPRSNASRQKEMLDIIAERMDEKLDNVNRYINKSDEHGKVNRDGTDPEVADGQPQSPGPSAEAGTNDVIRRKNQEARQQESGQTEQQTDSLTQALESEVNRFDSKEEFMDFHKTGKIRQDQFEADNFDWVDKSQYDQSIADIQAGDTTIELRKSTEPVEYTKTDEDGSIVRDDDGNVQYLSDEEMEERGLPTEETTIMAFDGDEAVGFAEDSFGATSVKVKPGYRQKGIGTKLLSKHLEQFENKRRFGQMTPQGQEFLSRVYDKFKTSDGVGEQTADRPSQININGDRRPSSNYFQSIKDLVDYAADNSSDAVTFNTRQIKQTDEYQDWVRYAQENDFRGKDISSPAQIGLNFSLTMERLAQRMDGGIDGRMYNEMVRPVYEAAEKAKKEASEIKDAVEETGVWKYSSEDEDAALLAMGEKTADEVSENAAELASRARQIYDDLLERINRERDKLGLEPINRREDYVTQIHEINTLSEAFGGIERISEKRRIRELKKELVPEIGAQNPDWPESRVDQVAFERAKRKVDGAAGVNKYVDAKQASFNYKERLADKAENPSLIESVDQYKDAALRYIYQAENIAKNKAYKDALPPQAKEFARKWNTSFVANRPGGDINLGQGPKKLISKIRSTLGSNTLSGNLGTITLQLASYPQVATFTGTRNLMWGLAKHMKDTVTSGDTLYDKSMTQSFRDLESDIGNADTAFNSVLWYLTRMDATKDIGAGSLKAIEAGRNFINGLMNKADRFTAGVTYNAFYHQYTKAGMKPEKAGRMADIMVGKTQANYFQEARPVFMQNMEGRTLGQFGTFIFNMFETVKQDLGTDFSVQTRGGYMGDNITEDGKVLDQDGNVIADNITEMTDDEMKEVALTDGRGNNPEVRDGKVEGDNWEYNKDAETMGVASKKTLIKQIATAMVYAYTVDMLSEEGYGRQPHSAKEFIDDIAGMAQGEDDIGDVYSSGVKFAGSMVPFISSFEYGSGPPAIDFLIDVGNAVAGGGRSQEKSIEELKSKHSFNTFMPYGGNQVRKTFQGVEAAYDIDMPLVEDVTENKEGFDIEGTISKLKALVYGPYATQSGIDYFKRTDRRKSIKEDYNISGSITDEENIRKLQRMSDEEFKVYTSTYASSTMETIWQDMSELGPPPPTDNEQTKNEALKELRNAAQGGGSNAGESQSSGSGEGMSEKEKALQELREAAGN